MKGRKLEPRNIPDARYCASTYQRRDRVFHLKSCFCTERMNKKHIRDYHDRRSAIIEGLRGCKRCQP